MRILMENIQRCFHTLKDKSSYIAILSRMHLQKKQPTDSLKVTETWSKELTRPFEKSPVVVIKKPWYRKIIK